MTDLKLRDYQTEGVQFGLERDAILNADDMGLGKTVQAISICVQRKLRRVLVICPATVKINWTREFRAWAPEDQYPSIGYAGGSFVPDTQVVVINYDILDRNLAAVKAKIWDAVILDEAQYIKNPKAKRTKAVLQLTAPVKIALTGTPFVNRPIELWPILNWLGSGIDYMTYARKYCGAYQRKITTYKTVNGRKTPVSRYVLDVTGASNLGELKKNLEPVMIRRLKADVLTELPAKTRQVIELETFRQARAERSMIKKLLGPLLPVGAASESVDEQLSVLQDAPSASFSELAKLRHDTAVAKVPFVLSYLEDCLEAEDKVIVFAHHRDVLEAIQEGLRVPSVLLYGGMTAAKKQKAIDSFQNDPACRVFIGQTQAAGVGITLTAGSHVVFAELDWVPGNIAQAEDRAHRFGQEQKVLVTYLVVDGTVDSLIARSIVTKKVVIDAVYGQN